jgi:hypothetical protein
MEGEDIQLLENDFSSSLDEMSMKYLTLYNSFPAFVANLTLTLFENQTIMA